MADLNIVRLSAEWFESSKYTELTSYLKDHWERALLSRQDQVDQKYHLWQQQYDAVPAQAKRITPWPGASNIVVPITRMFIDTFVARTLNIVFATRPLFTLEFLPADLREAVQTYFNRKCVHDWDYYSLARKLLFRGAKNGTVVTKTPWVVEQEFDVQPQTEQLITTFSGPKTTCIPFEDFYIYPITAETLEQADILFHKIRYTEESARRLISEGKWNGLGEEDVEHMLQMPTDIKRDSEQTQAGLSDPYLREVTIIECHLRYPVRTNGNYYQVIALYQPTLERIVDIYYNPYPRNLRIFQDYRPAPKEDLFFGDSWCQLLQQIQEESSTIHNDRRNNSYIANAPIFKRRSNSLMPNAGIGWYPGKIMDLTDMDDFDVIMLGRNYNDMLPEENHAMMLGERLMGIGAVMQGNASGMMGKRGIYNAAGTLAVLSESNQRQDTNIRDIRQVLGAIGKIAFTLQSQYGADDPIIDTFSPQVANQIREGLAKASPDLLAKSYLEIKASDAGANSEVYKANLLQMASVVGQYGAVVPQMATQLLTVQEPRLRDLLLQVVEMQRWMARRLMRAFNEFDGADILPDVAAVFNGAAEAGMAAGPGGGGEAGNPQAFLGGGAPPAGGSQIPPDLAALASLPIPNA